MHRPHQDLQNMKFNFHASISFHLLTKWSPNLYLILGLFRAFKASRAPEGPQIKFSHILMHRPYRDLHNLKFSCLYLIPFAHKVVPQKASGRGGGGGGRIPHFNWLISVAKRKACLRQKRHRAGSVSLFCAIVSSSD